MTILLQMTVLLGSIAVIGPETKSATASSVTEVLKYGSITAAILLPNLIEDLCRTFEGLSLLSKLNYVQSVGAPLKRTSGEVLARNTKLISAMGNTEAGPYLMQVDKDHEWNYHKFCPSLGLGVAPRGEGLYEPVFRRKEEWSQWQQIFQIYPDLDEYCTKDLMRLHPTKPNM